MVVHALVGFSMVYFAQDGCPFSDRATQNIYFLLFPVQLFLFLCFIKVGLLMNQFIRRLAARWPLNIQPGPLNHTHTYTTRCWWKSTQNHCCSSVKFPCSRLSWFPALLLDSHLTLAALRRNLFFTAASPSSTETRFFVPVGWMPSLNRTQRNRPSHH